MVESECQTLVKKKQRREATCTGTGVWLSRRGIGRHWSAAWLRLENHGEVGLFVSRCQIRVNSS